MEIDKEFLTSELAAMRQAREKHLEALHQADAAIQILTQLIDRLDAADPKPVIVEDMEIRR